MSLAFENLINDVSRCRSGGNNDNDNLMGEIVMTIGCCFVQRKARLYELVAKGYCKSNCVRIDIYQMLANPFPLFAQLSGSFVSSS